MQGGAGLGVEVGRSEQVGVVRLCGDVAAVVFQCLRQTEADEEGVGHLASGVLQAPDGFAVAAVALGGHVFGRLEQDGALSFGQAAVDGQKEFDGGGVGGDDGGGEGAVQQAGVLQQFFGVAACEGAAGLGNAALGRGCGGGHLVGAGEVEAGVGLAEGGVGQVVGARCGKGGE